MTTDDPLSGMLDLYCRELKLPGLRTGYAAIARDAMNQGQSYPAFLAACLASEIASRREHRLTTRLAQARFPVAKTLETFDFAAIPELSSTVIRTLAEGAFIGARENVILLGNPGTGKTHIATAIGVGCIQTGYRVRFIAAVTLAQELLAAQQEYRLPRYLKSWHPIDLVILDELAIWVLDPVVRSSFSSVPNATSGAAF